MIYNEYNEIKDKYGECIINSLCEFINLTTTKY
jgi:hypothetical protein